MNHIRPGHYLILALATAAALAPGLASMPLAETSEGRYASIAAAMAESGDWVVPRYNGMPHLEKPPLTYWFAAASIRLLGRTELAVRLPVLLAAIGLVLATAWLGAALFSTRTGLLAAGMLLGCVQFAGIERLLATDPFLALASAVGLCAFWAGFRAEEDPPRRRRAFLVFQIALAAGVLAKGPLGLLWPLCALVPALAAARRLSLLAHMRWPIGLVLIAGSLGIWLWALDQALPGAARYLLLDRATAAAREAKGFHEGKWWYYLPVLVGGFFPWVLLLPEVVRRWTASPDARAARWLLAAWVVAPLVLLSISPSKLFPYVFPMFPALAILAAWGAGEEGHGGRRVSIATAALMLLIGVAALVCPEKYLVKAAVPVSARTTAAIPAFLAAAIALGAAFLARATWRHAATAASVVVLTAGLAWGAAGVADDLFASKRIAERLAREARPGDRIVFFQCNPSGIPFYTGLRGILLEYVKLKAPAGLADNEDEARYWNREDPEELRTLLAERPRVLGVAKVRDYARALREGMPVQEVERTARQVLFTGVEPADAGEGR